MNLLRANTWVKNPSSDLTVGCAGPEPAASKPGSNRERSHSGTSPQAGMTMQKSSKKQEAPGKNPESPQLIDERFKLIARATNDVFWDWDLETNAVWRSEGASETFGYPPDELVSGIDFWINR